MKKFLKIIFNRTFLTSVSIILQFLTFMVIVYQLGNYGKIAFYSLQFISFFVVIAIVSKNDNPSYKLAWSILILTFPIFGGLFYLMFGHINFSGRMKRNMIKALTSSTNSFDNDKETINKIENISPSRAKQVRYIKNLSKYSVYENTYSEYLSPGERKFERLVEELKKAKKFIFLEYFIIEEGKMWNTILDILVEKVAEGVDVRLIYDDVGNLFTLPSNYHKKLQKMGLRVLVFNPFRPMMNSYMNYRDHRKIVVIDGNVAFTGGINLADEYINERKKHGDHWKDASIMLKGDACWNLTKMFLQMWQFQTGEDINYSLYHPTEKYESDGFVVPFGDTPLDNVNPIAGTYLNMINSAKDYVYICTPYLILDNETITALTMAAQSGVDVRIITPKTPDKLFVHLVTRTYYKPLIESGVKIYEYLPGFIHSKTIVSDDVVSTVGTANLDFRSLYLHFECCVYQYSSKTALDIKDDFMKTLAVSENITMDWVYNRSVPYRIFCAILKMFAPLM